MSAQRVGEALLRPVRPCNAFEDTVGGCCRPSASASSPRENRYRSERDLAARLQVSRDTVREAIKSLAEAGYLVSRRGRYGGTFLADELQSLGADGTQGITRAELDDTLRPREILEVGAARMAAARNWAPQSASCCGRG